jgi:cellobiose-specific phosphotransferase system component IIA
MTINAKLIAGANISPGMIVHLTFDQFDSRRHLLKPRGEAHKGRRDERRLPYTSEQTLFFKAGEEIGIDGVIDRQLQAAIGASDEQVVAADAAKPGLRKAVTAARKGQITKARNRLREAEEDAALAQKALSEAKPEKKAAAEKKVAEAEAAVAAAREALAKLEA